MLKEAKEKSGIADRKDIRTIPELIDFDEGRIKQPRRQGSGAAGGAAGDE